MHKVKTMSYNEKFAVVIEKMKPNGSLISLFIKKHLSEKALFELQQIWKEGIKPIPQNASDEEKYEIAYSNLMWRGKSNLKFIRMHLGEDGIEQYKRAQVDELKRKNVSPTLFILRVLRAVAPGSAFIVTAKKMAYKFQWITPFSLVELTRNKAAFNIPRCKVIGFPDMEESCTVDCQSVYPMWLAEQFKIGLKFERQGDSCKAILTL